MRAIIVSVMLAVLVPLGGCFHHTQAVAVTPLTTPSLKWSRISPWFSQRHSILALQPPTSRLPLTKSCQCKHDRLLPKRRVGFEWLPK